MLNLKIIIYKFLPLQNPRKWQSFWYMFAVIHLLDNNKYRQNIYFIAQEYIDWISGLFFSSFWSPHREFNKKKVFKDNILKWNGACIKYYSNQCAALCVPWFNGLLTWQNLCTVYRWLFWSIWIEWSLIFVSNKFLGTKSVCVCVFRVD